MRTRTRLLACSGALSVLLAACASTPPPAPPQASASPNFVKDPRTPLDQYAVLIDRLPETVALSVHPSGVSPAQRAALQHFAERWRETGGAEAITVQAPVNSAEPADARLAARAIAGLLNALGVPPSRLRLADYDAGGAPGAPVYARYERYEAQGPDCTENWNNLVATRENKPYTHFGCAHAANLAAMVADPHDLERPAAMSPADSIRRSVVLGKYRQGEVSSSAKDDQALGLSSQTSR